MNCPVTNLLPIKTETAAPAARTILESAKSNMGMVPNMYAGMANLPALLQAYVNGYGLFRANCGLTPVEQDVVFLTISVENGCEYCTAAHSFVADTWSKVPVEVTNAIRDDREIRDRTLQALRQMTRTLVAKRGRASCADVQSFVDAGYSEVTILALILAIGIKTFSTYSNHIMSTPLDSAFAGRTWKQGPMTGPLRKSMA